MEAKKYKTANEKESISDICNALQTMPDSILHRYKITPMREENLFKNKSDIKHFMHTPDAIIGINTKDLVIHGTNDNRKKAKYSLEELTRYDLVEIE